MTSWAKKGTVRTFGVVAAKTSVESRAGRSVLIGSGGCRVSARENRETLVER